MIASYMGWRGSKPNFGLVDGVASATNLRGNTIKYGSIGGTGGTSPATYVATGNAPDGWWLQDASAVANAGHTAVMSRVPRDGYPSLNWWRSVVSWTAAQNSVATFTHRLTPAASYTLPVGYSAGDVFDAAVELQYSGTNAGPLTIEVFCRTGTTEIPGANMTWESGQSATTPTPAFSGVVRLNSLVFPAGADNFGIRVQARNLISTVGGYTLDLGRVIIAKRM
jgi:hypothetical protein